MSYEEDSERRAAQHRDNWKDEQLTRWDLDILELPTKTRISPENGQNLKSSRQNEREK